jgi:F420-non-reducing hydrogenase small subunit
MYLGTISLCSCGGCERSLLLTGEPLVALLSENNISFSGQLVDRHSISPSDIVLAAGCVRNSEEIELAREVSRTSRKVIAVGSCAVFGGIPGMASLPDEIASGHAVEGLPALLEGAVPLDSVMDIDYYIPGCPPPPSLILDSLKSVLEGYPPARSDFTVCAECRRRTERCEIEWRDHPGAGLAPDACLLSAGHLCLGPVTRGGCHAVCTGHGSICIGCRGPSDAVLSSELHSMFSDMVRYAASTAGVREEKVEKKLQKLLKYMYLFTRRDPVTRHRPREKVPAD